MMEALGVPTLLAATVSMGLIAGLFYAFSCAVMVGLQRADDRTLVGAMQSINANLSGWFAISFLGAPVLPAATAALHLGDDSQPVLVWIVAALVLYATTFVITIAVNVPLNNALAAAGEPDSVADLARVRQRFEAKWVRWNIARALTSTAAFGCLTYALLLRGAA